MLVNESLKEKYYTERKSQARMERKHLLNQYFLFNIYKPTLNSLYSRMNTMYKKKCAYIIKICQFYLLGAEQKSFKQNQGKLVLYNETAII